jgi:hypothetical protein
VPEGTEPGQRLMTDEEHAEAREVLGELRKHDREYLAEQLGGDPDASTNKESENGKRAFVRRHEGLSHG